MLTLIASECAVVHASLAHLQNSMLGNTEALQSRLTPLVTSVFDTALLGCTLTLSVLEEIHHFIKGTDLSKSLSGKRKMRCALDQDRLKELLTQIRGQRIAMTLLLTTFQRSVLCKYYSSTVDLAFVATKFFSCSSPPYGVSAAVIGQLPLTSPT
jgi:hypothetical protein